MKLRIEINHQLIFYILGAFLLIEAFFMLLPGFVGLGYGEDGCHVYFFTSATIAVVGGALMWFFRRRTNTMSKQDSYIVVVMLWLCFALFGMLPYLFGDHLDGLIDSFFESMSGITTTGATLMKDLDNSPHGILLWRSLMQWIGGMGIITLSLILLPAMGVGGMQLFSAEASVTRSDKIHPKITEMAKYIWLIYVGLTALEVVLLWLGDMPFFDAVCHSLSTLSTGGFSTKNDSIEYFHSAYIEYIVLIFMYLGGVNFVLFYSVILHKASRLFTDEELKYYTLIFVVLSLLTATLVLVGECYESSEKALRDGAFQIISVMTSTGFTTTNYMLWPASTVTLLALAMLTGTCTGSTSGGIKFMRLIVMFRGVGGELKRALHPTAVVSVKYNAKAVAPTDVQNVLMFIVLYIVILFGGVIAISLCGHDFEDAFGLAASALGNIGICVGSYGYTASLCDLSAVVKLVMAALMLIGRLEIFTVILIFAPSFWKR